MHFDHFIIRPLQEDDLDSYFQLIQKNKKRLEDFFAGTISETQTLEDVICLVFLEFYFEPFAHKHPEDKTIDILQKTWKKMSKAGQEAALKLPFTPEQMELLTKALA